MLFFLFIKDQPRLYSMALPRQKFREILFQLLYSLDFTSEFEEESCLIASVMDVQKVSRRWVTLALERAKEIQQKLVEIDQRIEIASTSYALSRIPRVEKNILRLGIFELLFDKDQPKEVSIAEAIRLAKKFATTESSQFINAILDGIGKSLHEPLAESQTGRALS